jgi:hypothetical protein
LLHTFSVSFWLYAGTLDVDVKVAKFSGKATLGLVQQFSQVDFIYIRKEKVKLLECMNYLKLVGAIKPDFYKKMPYMIQFNKVLFIFCPAFQKQTVLPDISELLWVGQTLKLFNGKHLVKSGKPGLCLTMFELCSVLRENLGALSHTHINK